MKIEKIPYGKIVLGNGFVIYYLKRPAPDVVYMNIYYRAGSGYEKDGIRGISHLLEHLMFKGTKNYPKNYLTELLAPLGGDSNAYTSWDSTVFYAQFPAHIAKEIFLYEKDRMENLSFEDFEKELNVVIDEKKLTVESNPFGLFSERLFYTTFLLHSYRYPVIGTENDLVNMNENKVYRFYREFYTPRNAFMILSGNVTSSVLEDAVKVFSGTEKGGALYKVASCDVEPKQSEMRVFFMKRPGFGAKVITVLFKTVPFAHKDIPYLDVISTMLGDGKNSYLYEKLVLKDGMFTSISTEVYETQACTIHTITGTVVKNKNPMKAIEKLMKYLSSPSGLFTKKRFKRAILNIYADLIYSRESIRSLGDSLGEFALLSEDTEFNEFPQKLLSVEFGRLESIYNSYFRPELATVGILTED